MNILLLGSTGQLGWELNRTLFSFGNLIALDYPQIDMSDPKNINSVVKEYNPSIIINSTAYTNVDKAETEPELAMAINGTGPGILAEEAKRISAALIHYSTDYVFDGLKGTPYTEEDLPTPISVYGESKLVGENAIREIGGAYLIFRTSWVYSLRRPSFVTKVLEWARKYETLRIVDDQISRPTWARSLAEMTAQVIAQGINDPVGYIQEKRGLYNLGDNGFCSRYEWAQAILRLDPDKETQLVEKILPVGSDEFVLPAMRPLDSTLDLSKFIKQFNLIPPAWEISLKLAMNNN